MEKYIPPFPPSLKQPYCTAEDITAHFNWQPGQIAQKIEDGEITLTVQEEGSGKQKKIKGLLFVKEVETLIQKEKEAAEKTFQERKIQYSQAMSRWHKKQREHEREQISFYSRRKNPPRKPTPILVYENERDDRIKWATQTNLRRFLVENGWFNSQEVFQAWIAEEELEREREETPTPTQQEQEDNKIATIAAFLWAQIHDEKFRAQGKFLTRTEFTNAVKSYLRELRKQNGFEKIGFATNEFSRLWAGHTLVREHEPGRPKEEKKAPYIPDASKEKSLFAHLNKGEDTTGKEGDLQT